VLGQHAEQKQDRQRHRRPADADRLYALDLRSLQHDKRAQAYRLVPSTMHLSAVRRHLRGDLPEWQR
jgi:hypothetical protein